MKTHLSLLQPATYLRLQTAGGRRSLFVADRLTAFAGRCSSRLQEQYKQFFEPLKSGLNPSANREGENFAGRLLSGQLSPGGISMRTTIRKFVFCLCTLTVGAAHAALQVEGEINPNPVRPGEQVRVAFTVVNDGLSTEANVTLEAEIPTGFDVFSDYPLEYADVYGPGECPSTSCSAGEDIVWTLGSLAPGQATTVGFWANVAAATADATDLTVNAAVIDGDLNQDDTVSVTTTVQSGQVVSLFVEDNADPAAPGDELVYAITYGNYGSLAISGAAIDLPLPADVTFVSATGGGSESLGTVSWALGTLEPGISGTLLVTANVSNSATAGDLLVVDSAALTGMTVEAVPVAVAASAQAITQVTATTPLTANFEINPDPVRSGDFVRAEITVANNTGSVMSGVVLQALMPEDVLGIGDSPTEYAGLYGEGACYQTTCTSAELITWQLGSLAAGQSVTVAFWPEVGTVDTGEQLLFEAWVIDDSGNEAIASRSIPVANDKPLTLAIEDSLDPVIIGDTLVYTLTYGNHGLLSISGTTLSFELPEGTTFVSASGGGVASAGTVDWSLGTLVAGESGVLEVAVSVDNSVAAGELLVTGYGALTGQTVEAFPEAVRSLAQTVTQIETARLLDLAVTVNPAPIRSSELMLVELTVSNTSGATMFGAELQARMPEHVGQVYDSPNEYAQLLGNGTCYQGSCTSGELITWQLGDLAAGQSTTVAFWPTVATVDTGELLVVDARVTDDAGREAVISRSIPVRNDQDVSLRISSSRDPVSAADEITYTLTYGNHGLSTLTNAGIELPLPSLATFVSATDGGTAANGVVSWNLGSLAAGASGKVSAVVTVGSAIDSDQLIVDAAQLNSDTQSARAQHTTRAATSGINLSVTSVDDAVRSGETLLTEISLTNNSGGTLFNSVLQARMPEGVQQVYDSPNEYADLLGNGTCYQGSCTSGELITWQLGNLAPGQSTVVSFWPVVASVDSGELLIVDVRALADAGNETRARTVTPVNANAPLTLAIDESANSVASGGALEYTMVFGNRSIQTVNNVVLELPIPDGLSFSSATFGNPDVNAERVLWNIGDLPAGEGGMVKAAFTVNPAQNSDHVKAAPVIRGDDAESRTEAITRVDASSSLQLVVDVLAPNQPGDTVVNNFSVTNTTGGTLFGVTLQSRVPDAYDQFVDSAPAVVGGGTCYQSTCSAGELITWAIGNMAAGATVDVSYTTTVANGLDSGLLISVAASATEDAGSQTMDAETVLIGPDSDADQDGISDTYEDANGLDQNDPADALGDEDSDGLLNVDEFLLGTGLNDPDSDMDTVLDGADNCALDSNPDQNDNDMDSLGDVCDADDDNDGVLDVDDNCQFAVNNDQADGDNDGIGNACEPPPPADVTEAGDTSGNGDFALLLQGAATGSQVQIFDGASGAMLNSIDFFSWVWEAIAIDTISDGNGDGIADDPAIAMLAVRPDNGQIKVQFRSVADGSVLRTNLPLFNINWEAIDLAIIDDMNGDGTTGDTGVAVVAINKATGRNEVRVLPLDSTDFVPVFQQRYFNPEWVSTGVEAFVAPGGGDILIGVMATNSVSGKTILQRRQLSDGVRMPNVYAFGASIKGSDLTVLKDTDGNGTADDPSVVFYGTNLSNGNSIVRTRRMDNGAIVSQFRILGNSFTPQKITTLPDADGNDIDELAGSAIRNSDDSLFIKLRDSSTTATVSEISP